MNRRSFFKSVSIMAVAAKLSFVAPPYESSGVQNVTNNYIESGIWPGIDKWFAEKYSEHDPSYERLFKAERRAIK